MHSRLDRPKRPGRLLFTADIISSRTCVPYVTEPKPALVSCQTPASPEFCHSAIDELPGGVVTLARDEFRNLFTPDYRLFRAKRRGWSGVAATSMRIARRGGCDAHRDCERRAVTSNGNGTNIGTSTGAAGRSVGSARSEGVFRSFRGGRGRLCRHHDGPLVARRSSEATRVTRSKPRLLSPLALPSCSSALSRSSVSTRATRQLPEHQDGLAVFRARPGCDELCDVYGDSGRNAFDRGRPDRSDDGIPRTDQSSSGQTLPSGSSAEGGQRVVEDIPTIGIQKAFTYPAIFGPGTMGFTFTLRPGSPGADPYPQQFLQLNLATATLLGQEPADDSVFPLQISRLRSWSRIASHGQRARQAGQTILSAPDHRQRLRSKAAPAPTPTSFRAVTTGGLSPIRRWTNGGSVRPAKPEHFRPKRIRAVTIITPGQEWQLTLSTVNLRRDTTYARSRAKRFRHSGSLGDLLVEADVDIRRRAGPGGNLRVPSSIRAFVSGAIPSPDSYPVPP